NPRSIDLLLEAGGDRLEASFPGVDARQLLPGEEVEIRARVRVPADAAEGSARLALRLPDPAASLRGDPRYAIQLANVGTWDAATGDNVLATVDVRDDAPGDVDPTTSDLELTAVP